MLSEWNLPVENLQLANLEKNVLLKQNESEVVRHISHLLFHLEVIANLYLDSVLVNKVKVRSRYVDSYGQVHYGRYFNEIKIC